MKPSRLPFLKIIGWVVFFSCISQPAASKINFNDFIQDRIDLGKISLDKEQFFTFITETIAGKPFGLGAYGRVSVKICDMLYKGRKLIDYKTEKGIDHRFLSNPSCSQTVLRKILEKSYGFNAGSPSVYQDRKCILNVEKIFSPMLEYYTIKYEEKTKPDCRRCEDNEKWRLQKIIAAQKAISEACHDESKSILEFLSDLDAQIENAFRKKRPPNQP